MVKTSVFFIVLILNSFIRYVTVRMCVANLCNILHHNVIFCIGCFSVFEHHLYCYYASDLCFFAAATRLIQEGSTGTAAGQTPTIVALNFNKQPPLSVCPQTCSVTDSGFNSAQSITSPRPGILRKRAHDATLVTFVI